MRVPSSMNSVTPSPLSSNNNNSSSHHRPRLQSACSSLSSWTAGDGLSTSSAEAGGGEQRQQRGCSSSASSAAAEQQQQQHETLNKNHLSSIMTTDTTSTDTPSTTTTTTPRLPLTQRLVHAHQSMVEQVHDWLVRGVFGPIFAYCAQHARLVFWSILALSLALPALAVATNSIAIKSDAEYLVPQHSYPAQQEEWIRHTFTTSRPSFILLHAAGANVATAAGIQKLWQVEQAVWQFVQQQQAATPGGFCGSSLTQAACHLLSATNFWKNQAQFTADMAAAAVPDETVRATLSKQIFVDGSSVDRSLIFGKYETTNDNNNSNNNNNGGGGGDQVVSAQSFRTTLLLGDFEADDKWNVELELSQLILDLNEQWAAQEKEEEEAAAVAANNTTTTTTTTKTPHFRLEVFNFGSVNQEVDIGVAEDTPLVALSICVMGLYAAVILTRCGKNAKQQVLVSSHGMLGLGATVTVMLSMATAYSLCALLGQPITGLSQALPFILIGIGMDDSFVIMGAFSQTAEHLNLTERLKLTGKVAGPSIFVTSLTDVCAFGLGAWFSTVPSIRIVGIFAITSISIDFIYQITFFIALLALDQRRLKADRRDFVFCCKAKNRGVGPGGDEDDDDAGDDSDEDDDEQQQKDEENGDHYQIENIPSPTFSERTERQESSMDRIVHIYTKALLHPISKVLVIASFIAVLAFGAYGASRAEVDFEVTALMRPDSYLRDYEDADNAFFSTAASGLRAEVYVNDVDMSDPAVQDSIENFLQDLYDNGYIDAVPNSFWLKDFRIFNRLYGNSSATFAENLDEFMSFPRYRRPYQQDIVRDEFGKVIASRVPVTLTVRALDPAAPQIDLLVGQRELTLNDPLNAQGKINGTLPIFLFSERFEYFDHFDRLSNELMTSMVMSTVAVAIISLLFLPHIIGTILTIFVIGAVNVELVGVVYYGGYYINTASLFILIMSVGLTVDYCMHVVHSYLHSFRQDFSTRDERVEHALKEIGVSVFLGGFSTFLGVLALALAQNESKFFMSILFGVVQYVHNHKYLTVLFLRFSVQNSFYSIRLHDCPRSWSRPDLCSCCSVSHWANQHHQTRKEEKFSASYSKSDSAYH